MMPTDTAGNTNADIAEPGAPTIQREPLRGKHIKQSYAAPEQQNQQQTAPQSRYGTADNSQYMKHRTHRCAAGQYRRTAQRQADDQGDEQAKNNQGKGDGRTCAYQGGYGATSQD